MQTEILLLDWRYILFAGHLLAYAALDARMEVTWIILRAGNARRYGELHRTIADERSAHQRFATPKPGWCSICHPSINTTVDQPGGFDRKHSR